MNPVPASASPAAEAAPAEGRAQRVLAALAAAPHRFDFYVALRAVEAAFPELPRLGAARRPGDEPVRLGQGPDLAFAATSLSAVDLADRSGRPRIEVRFFGLFGPNGPLPLHLTAHARERMLHRADETFARFADLFHHRLLLLFYRAWAQAQPTASLDRPDDDRFATHVASLIGCGGDAWRGRDPLPDHARLAFAGVLARQARSADGLARMLSGYLGRPVRIESFAGRWMRLDPAERTRLARAPALRRRSSAQLGASAVLGGTVFDRQHHFRVHVGPLDAAGLATLLPSGRALAGLSALIAHHVGLELGWELDIELAEGSALPARLGRGTRLGWTGWLGTLPPGRRPRLRLQPPPGPPAASHGAGAPAPAPDLSLA